MSIREALRQARVGRWLRHCASVGNDPRISGTPSIFAEEGRLLIGHRFRLASTPVGSHLGLGDGAVMDIGDDVSIGCGAAIAALQEVRIGSGTRIGPFVIIMDTNFHSGAGDQSVLHDCQPVIIGSNCRIGTRVTIMKGATIGDGAEILAGSVVTSAIPPGACAAGVRARIIGRAGEAASRWNGVAAALPDLLMTTLDLKSPPDLDGSPIPTQAWNDDRVSQMLQALRDRFSVAWDRADLVGNSTYAEIAATLQRAMSNRRFTPSAGDSRGATSTD